MTLLYTICGWPLGWVMWLCYKVVPVYGIALILFTIITRLILVPLSIKQKKASAKMAIFQPKVNEINKKYANNKEKQQEALMQLYEEEHYNPMSSCLPSLIQFPILFGLIDVIYKPLTYLLRVPKAALEAFMQVGEKAGIAVNTLSSQIFVLNKFKEAPDLFSGLDAETISHISSLDMNFLGMDLTAIPKLAFTVDGKFNWLILVPIASGVAALVHSMYTMRSTQAPGQETNSTMKMMMFGMPVFSLIIAFQFPVGLSFYWTLSSVIMLIQEIVLNIWYSPAKLTAKMEAEAEEKKRLKKEAREKAKTEAKETGKQTLSAKELDKKRLAEARRRDAEKYGEEYVEVTDEDLK